MKWVLTVLLILTLSQSNAQKTFRVKGLTWGEASIKVNGTEFLLDSTYTEISTGNSTFDTLQISGGANSYDTRILCNFKNDSSYSLKAACCASIDIVPSWKLDYDSLKIWGAGIDTNLEKYHYKFQSWMLDNPSFTIKIKNGSVKDSIYAWNASYSCPPYFKQLDQIGWKYGVPTKCFYWSNLNFFQFFKTNLKPNDFEIKDGVLRNNFPDISLKLGTQAIRLFDNDHYTLTYDLKTKEIILSKD